MHKTVLWGLGSWKWALGEMYCVWGEWGKQVLKKKTLFASSPSKNCQLCFTCNKIDLSIDNIGQNINVLKCKVTGSTPLLQLSIQLRHHRIGFDVTIHISPCVNNLIKVLISSCRVFRWYSCPEVTRACLIPITMISSGENNLPVFWHTYTHTDLFIMKVKWHCTKSIELLPTQFEISLYWVERLQRFGINTKFYFRRSLDYLDGWPLEKMDTDPDKCFFHYFK